VSTFFCWVTLVQEVDAEDEGEAFDQMMELIEHRDGMDISSHEIIAGEER